MFNYDYEDRDDLYYDYCKACGTKVATEDLHDSEYCANCVMSVASLKNYYDWAEETSDVKDVEMNAFLMKFFTKKEIDAILLKELDKKMSEQKDKCERVIEQYVREGLIYDLGDFAKNIVRLK